MKQARLASTLQTSDELTGHGRVHGRGGVVWCGGPERNATWTFLILSMGGQPSQQTFQPDPSAAAAAFPFPRLLGPSWK